MILVPTQKFTCTMKEELIPIILPGAIIADALAVNYLFFRPISFAKRAG
jgi:hypothetical protein